MDIVHEFIRRLPPKYRRTPSGWISGNAMCCHHRGHRVDKKGRGGIMLTKEGGFVTQCFNCGFKASWVPGRTLSANAKKFLGYLGASEEEIAKINFEALRNKQNNVIISNTDKFASIGGPICLPKDAKPFKDWCDNPPADFIDVLTYISEVRNPDLINWYEFYWSPSTLFNMNRRFIIPFKSGWNSFLFGYTSRAIDNTIEPKYLCKCSDSYMFGQDNIFKQERKYVIVMEGVLDAIAIGGCAVMKQTMSSHHISMLKSSNKTVIIVPDRDASGKNMVIQALDNNFAVSMPDWPEEYKIKDVDDAVKIFGRVATLAKIINSAMINKLKIQLQMKKWFKECVR